MSSRFEGTHLSSTTPPYPMPPLTYEGNRMLTIQFRTSPEVLRALVPEPLVVNPDNLMKVYVAAFNIVDPVPYSYYEAGLLIDASDGRDEGSYAPVLYLDKALPITIGREVWGYPKFQADFVLKEQAGVIQARVTSGTASLIDATLRLTTPIPAMNVCPRCFFLMKTIPSVTGRSTYDVKQLTTAVLRNELNKEMQMGDATLRFGSTSSDPLGEIPILEMLKGAYFTGGFVLDYGRVVHDYLSKA